MSLTPEQLALRRNSYRADRDGKMTKPATHIQANCSPEMYALNIDNHNRSDSQTDYFDVGHYTSINLGSWNKPFVVK